MRAVKVRAGRGACGITYLNEKVEPACGSRPESLAAPMSVPCDVLIGQLERSRQSRNNGPTRLCAALHRLCAFTEDLRTGVVNCSAEGFALAMDALVIPLSAWRSWLLPMTDGVCLRPASMGKIVR